MSHLFSAKLHTRAAIGTAAAIGLIVAVQGGSSDAGDRSTGLVSQQTPKPSVAVIINNDPSDRHILNVSASELAIAKYGFERIVVLGGQQDVPTLRDVLEALRDIQDKNERLALLYLTGHGSLLRTPGSSRRQANIMLRDRPMTAGHLAPLLGVGPCLIYADQCFGPSFSEELEKQLRGDFIFLCDKNPENPVASCRGISTRFWELVEARSEESGFRDAAIAAWRIVSPNGLRLMSSSTR